MQPADSPAAGGLWQSLRWLSRRMHPERRRTLAFLVSIYRRHWRVVGPTVGLNLLATLFESSTVGLLVLALRTLVGPPAMPGASQLGMLERPLAALTGRVGTEGAFLALIALAVLAQLLVSALDFGSRAMVAHLQARVEGDLRRRFFRQLMAMSYAAVRRHKIGDLSSYNEQINYVGHVIQLSNLIFGHLLMIAAYSVLLAWLSWPMTLAALVAMALLSTALRGIVRRVRRLGRRFTRALVELNGRTVEYLGALRLIRTFGREGYAIEQVEEAISDAVTHRRQGLTWNATIGPLADAITVLGVAAFLIGGYALIYGRDPGSLPRLVTFLFVLYRLLPRIKFVNDRLGHVASHWEFVRRLERILRRDDKQYPRSGGRPFSGVRQAIEFSRVSLRYLDGERWAVRDLSLRLRRGTMTALVGESGGGKSSVADLLLGLYEPTEGAILVDGVDLRELDWESWRRHLAVVSQDTLLLHASVRDNIAFGRPQASDQEIRAAARVAHAEEFIADLTAGYDTLVGERGHRLSSGQRQRLAIARAVLRDPDLLILDEATSHLDSESERLIQESLARLRADRTLVVIAHRLSTVAAADQILVLDGGRLIERGDHRQLLAAAGLYARLWRLQSESAERPADPVGLSPG